MTTQHTLFFTASQHSIIGKHLYSFYYRDGVLGKLKELYPTQGYPHNGGEHSLTLSGSKEDLITWVELFESITSIKLDKIKEAIQRCEGSTRAKHFYPELFTLNPLY